MKVVINDCLSLSMAVTIDELETSSIKTATIGYRSPSGKTGYWDAIVSPEKKVDCEILPNILNELGSWYIWTKIITESDQKYSGTASILDVVNPWENS